MPVIAPKHVLRKYVPEYIKFIFSIVGSDSGLKTQCVENIFSTFFCHIMFFSHLFVMVVLGEFLEMGLKLQKLENLCPRDHQGSEKHLQ